MIYYMFIFNTYSACALRLRTAPCNIIKAQGGGGYKERIEGISEISELIVTPFPTGTNLLTVTHSGSH